MYITHIKNFFVSVSWILDEWRCIFKNVRSILVANLEEQQEAATKGRAGVSMVKTDE